MQNSRRSIPTNHSAFSLEFFQRKDLDTPLIFFYYKDMERSNQQLHRRQGFEKFFFILLGLLFVGGFVFSIISSLGLCDAECNQTKFYRFFGQPFAMIGLFFFGSAFLLYWLAQKRDIPHFLLGCLLAGAAGAEIRFIAIQKWEIGHWCPLCLAIAGIIALSLLLYGASAFLRTYRSSKQGNQEFLMKKIPQSLIFLLSGLLGLFLAFTGISKPDYALRAIDTMQHQIAFGNKTSPIEVYFVSDWFCDACRTIEPEVDQMAPLIMGKAQMYFIDYPMYRETVNFSPFNLAFMIHDKASYLKARHLLETVATKTKTPTESEIIYEAKQNKIPFRPLSYSEVIAGMGFFEKTTKKFDIEGTPTMVIINTKTGMKKELRGTDEITQENVMNAIHQMMGKIK